MKGNYFGVQRLFQCDSTFQLNIYALEIKVLSAPHFQLFTEKYFQLMYKSVFVFLQYTVVFIKFLECINMSKNAILFSFCISIVNFILLWKLFNDSRTELIQLEFIKQIVSSTYLFLNYFSSNNVRIIFCSSSAIKILAKTGHSGDPMATPSICPHVLLFRVKCIF